MLQSVSLHKLIADLSHPLYHSCDNRLSSVPCLYVWVGFL